MAKILKEITDNVSENVYNAPRMYRTVFDR